MIYLISQITFLFLTQIYYNMNFITSSSILPQDFPGTLRLIFTDCFWRTFFCLKELGILLKYRETFEKFIVAWNSSKNTGLPQFFFKVFWQLYVKNINFLTKTKRCFYAQFYEFKTKMTGKGKQNHIFQKSKSYEISSTVIYIARARNLLCILLVYPLRPRNLYEM